MKPNLGLVHEPGQGFTLVFVFAFLPSGEMGCGPRGILPAAGKRYVLRLFISLKYITANVVDRQRGRVVATASSVEKDLKAGIECGRFCNAKAAVAVGDVLALRLKVDGLAAEEIHADVAKEIQKKGFKNMTKVWAIINALRSHGVNLLFDSAAASAAASSQGDHRRGDDELH